VTVDKKDCSCQTKQKHGSGGKEQPPDAGGFLVDMGHSACNMGGFGGGGVVAHLAQPAVDMFPYLP